MRVTTRFSGRVRWSDERGFGLIEVMVTAVVVLLVGTATVSAIGTSQKQTAQTAARGVRANLAEQDQERMRAMRATDLVNYTATSTATKENVLYTINSKAEFVQGPDDSAVSCTSTGKQTDSLRLTTTVTPQASVREDPITVTSLRALPIAQFSPTSGTLTAQVFRADGSTPIKNVRVDIAGPESRFGFTNEKGCVVFQFLKSGDYTVSVNESGYVDRNLQQAITYSGTVSAGQINPTDPLLIDRAGQITATFNGASTGTSTGITFSHSGLIAPTTRKVTGSAVAKPLYPFTSPYQVYAGTCAANDPTLYEPNFYTTPGTFGTRVVPNTGVPQTVNLNEPLINTNITIKKANTSVVVGTPVVQIYQTDSGCETSSANRKTLSFNTTTGALSPATRMPYGTFWVCAQIAKTSGTGTNGTFSNVLTAVPNKVYTGTPTQALQIDTTNTNTTTSMRTCASR